MPTYAVKTRDETLTIEAEYYKRENMWVTFKDAENKVIHDLRDNNIVMISTLPAGTKSRVTTVTLKADTTDYMKSIDEAIAKTKLLGSIHDQVVGKVATGDGDD